MLIGPIVNGSAVAIGGALGAFLSTRIPERLRTALPLTFGLASIGMSITMVVKLKYLPAVILALILGAIIGELIYLEKGIGKIGGKVRKLIDRGVPAGEPDVAALSHDEFLEKFVAILVLFCASGTGIFGAMNEGMTGDAQILLTKSILDLFTAAIFATSLGYAVAVIAIPQFAIQMALALGASQILPMTTPMMIADFSGVGGMIMLATGFRICGIKSFPIANMLPALFIAMPISALWLKYAI